MVQAIEWSERGRLVVKHVLLVEATSVHFMTDGSARHNIISNTP